MTDLPEFIEIKYSVFQLCSLLPFYIQYITAVLFTVILEQLCRITSHQCYPHEVHLCIHNYHTSQFG